jgi:hypothetical protein
VESGQQVIVIEQANPQVIYVLRTTPSWSTVRDLSLSPDLLPLHPPGAAFVSIQF